MNDALASRLRKALAGRRGVTEKKMFGGVMQGFIWVDPARCDSRALKRWLAMAEAYVGKLQAK